MKLLRLHTHTLTKLHTEVMNFSPLWVSIMHGLTWSELNYCAWFVLSVSSLPLSVMVCSCHACVNSSHLCSLGFTPMLCSDSSPSPTRDSGLGISHAWNYVRTFGLHEIFHLKFTVYRRTGFNCENLIITNCEFSRVCKLLIHKLILLIAHSYMRFAQTQ